MAWTGGCLCGEVRYRAEADPFRVVHCHCGACRRLSGAAFLTFVAFKADGFAGAVGYRPRQAAARRSRSLGEIGWPLK